ncbi:MAG: aminotransferase class I/II-fold pyridoxal phosphate-dependent enzyme [bacterium]|nr:aminotransferase class I/II-fold pyridoxal phosphate-dependent enzyme [bacterium]
MTKALTAEEKRERFKQKLREKVLQEASPAEGHSNDIPEHCYRVERFHEYRELQQQFSMLGQLGIDNPYFKVNERFVTDTTLIDGREYISYAGYNYLGFSGDPRVSEAVKKAVEQYGTSASASRVATGERPLHQELEQELADLLETEDCLVFVSGYGTNVTVIGHLFGAKDLIIHDELSHSSILNGCLQIADRLFQHGINVQPILYPAVPEDASRLRFFLTCKHSEEQIRYTLDMLNEAIGH